MSILASFTSAISILGFSQEMYKYGTMYWIIGISYFITQPLAAEVYVPLFHGLKITSAYEVKLILDWKLSKWFNIHLLKKQYLEMRFDNKVRVLASGIFCLQMVRFENEIKFS